MIASVEATIVDAVLLASGLASGRVFWAGQNTDDPTQGEFITLDLLSERDIAQSGVEFESSFNDQQFVYSSVFCKEAQIALRVHTPAVTGTNSARLRLSKILNRLCGEVLTEKMALTDLALVDFGAMLQIPQFNTTQFQGLAQTDLRFRYRETEVESVTWVESVGITPAAFVAGLTLPIQFGSPTVTQ